MPIRFSCTTCGAKLSASSGKAGVGIRCPQCGAAIRVPRDTRTSHLALSPMADPPPGGADAPPSSPPPIVTLSDVAPAQGQRMEELAEGVHSSPSAVPLDPRLVAIPRRAIYVQALLLVAVAGAFCALGWWLAQ